MGKTCRQRLALQDHCGVAFYLPNLDMFGVMSHFDAVFPWGGSAIFAVAAAQDGLAKFSLRDRKSVV